MKIAFVLPCSGRYPIGGFRIVYEHANWLVRHGHDVTLFHATDLNLAKGSLSRRLASCARFVRNKVTRMYLPKSWFRLDPRLETRCSLTLDIDALSVFDAVVATAWQTAIYVAKARQCKKYYLIQHFEDWNSDAQSVLTTWRLPLMKIVISKWLKTLVEMQGEKCFLIANAIDSDFFYPTQPIEYRNPRSVLVQLHPKSWKGSKDALAAIKILRERGCEFELNLFGVAAKDAFEIEGAHTYCYNPSQETLRELYSRNAIFVAASWSEGWGLTPHEACACGAAVAATDIDGHREFLEPNVSALLSPPHQPLALARDIERLLCDQQLRTSIAQRGRETAVTFSWSKIAPLLETILRKNPEDVYQ